MASKARESAWAAARSSHYSLRLLFLHANARAGNARIGPRGALILATKTHNPSRADSINQAGLIRLACLLVPADSPHCCLS